MLSVFLLATSVTHLYCSGGMTMGETKLIVVVVDNSVPVLSKTKDRYSFTIPTTATLKKFYSEQE